MLLPSAIESIAGIDLRYSIKCLYWTNTWNINNFENKLLVCKLPPNQVTTKTKVMVSDYSTLVVFQFNCKLGLKENSKINNYVNLFCITYLLYGKMLYKHVFFIKIWSVKFIHLTWSTTLLKSKIELPTMIYVWSNFEFNCILSMASY